MQQWSIGRLIAALSFVLALALPGLAAAQTAVPGEPPLDKSVIDDLVLANRILANEGVLDGFGHISMRDPRNPNHFLQSRSVAPALVTAADIMVFGMDSEPLDPALKKRGLYYERFIHGEIYKRRPDVMAIVHSHSPTVVPFASTQFKLKPILHNAAFLGAGAPVFDIRKVAGITNMLISTPKLGAAMARQLGQNAVILLRGHGDVVVGPSIKVAVWRAYYTEINARMVEQAKVLDSPITYISPEEAVPTDKVMQEVVGRPWDLWKRKLDHQSGVDAAH